MSHRPALEAAVEAILFAASEPVGEERLLAAFDESEREEARSALESVRARYAEAEERGVRLEEVAGGLRIVTAPECHPYLRRFFDASGANRLSMAALETLAIVAYRQPVTGPEIHELRGKNSSTALHTLLDRRMIRITGRREVVGRPFVYATTREFLMHFGLRDLEDLPPLEEFEEALGLEVTGRDDAGISEEHEAIGLVSTEEAEATLGSARFGVHEHADEDRPSAADSDRESAPGGDASALPAGAADPEADPFGRSSERGGEGRSGASSADAERSVEPARSPVGEGGASPGEGEREASGPLSVERDLVGVSERKRDSGSAGGGVDGEADEEPGP